MTLIDWDDDEPGWVSALRDEAWRQLRAFRFVDQTDPLPDIYGDLDAVTAGAGVGWMKLHGRVWLAGWAAERGVMAIADHQGCGLREISLPTGRPAG